MKIISLLTTVCSTSICYKAPLSRNCSIECVTISILVVWKVPKITAEEENNTFTDINGVFSNKIDL